MTQACMVIKGYPGYPSETIMLINVNLKLFMVIPLTYIPDIVHGHSFNVYPWHCSWSFL